MAIAVQDDGQFADLCEVIGMPDLALDAPFMTATLRRRNKDELHPLIESWTSRNKPQKVVEYLQGVGLPAGMRTNYVDILDDPHMEARGFWQGIDRPVNGGKHPYYDFPPILHGSRPASQKPSPTIGEDNDFIFAELLSLSRGELQTLKDEGVIGTVGRLG